MRVALGASKSGQELTPWEGVLAEMITGDFFGADRIDYLLRDSYHAGVAYGRFDHYRLIDSLRILPRQEGSEELVLGATDGGLHAAEGMMLARYFMFSQVYFHRKRQVYDVHLFDYLAALLNSIYGAGTFPVDVATFQTWTDNEVMAYLTASSRKPGSAGHDAARRILTRDVFRELYAWKAEDYKTDPEAVGHVFAAAKDKFGVDAVRLSRRASDAVDAAGFPVLRELGGKTEIVPAANVSEVMIKLPALTIEYVFIDPSMVSESEKWLSAELHNILQPGKE
jgi:HD superfamily phosphohydrolase